MNHTFDLAGRDRSRPLSDMIDMPAYRARRERARRDAARDRARHESREFVIVFIVGPAIVGFLLAIASSPTTVWTHLAALLGLAALLVLH